VKRRTLLIGIGAALGLVGGRSWAQRRPPRIGVLTVASSAEPPSPLAALQAGLAELGYTEGQNVILEYRFARGDYGAFPGLVADLVALPVDIIVVDGGAAVPPAMAATKSIPIVIATAGDPVRLGFVTNLARPGGNVTGFSLVSIELNLKRLELLRAAFPDAGAATVLFNPNNATAVDGVAAISDTSRTLGIAISLLEARNNEALQTLDVGSSNSPLLIVPDAMFWNSRRVIIARLNGGRRPAIYPEREYADDGGLIAYGPNVPDNFRRAAGYVDRILKGTAPGELPIQQPARFDFVVNLKTARSLGLILPASFLARADEVIE
jgi:putative tryptophan/tyrosine transport system substrate-binding protein